MVTFTPDGQYVLAANEGEPSDDYQIDPEGSISVVDVSNPGGNLTVRTADFLAFNSQDGALKASGVRIYGPGGATVAQDLEPEYITVSADSRTAWVSLQENNALAKLDIGAATVTGILPPWGGSRITVLRGGRVLMPRTMTRHQYPEMAGCGGYLPSRCHRQLPGKW